jgi:hypothetical protein
MDSEQGWIGGSPVALRNPARGSRSLAISSFEVTDLQMRPHVATPNGLSHESSFWHMKSLFEEALKISQITHGFRHEPSFAIFLQVASEDPEHSYSLRGNEPGHRQSRIHGKDSLFPPSFSQRSAAEISTAHTKNHVYSR